MDASILVNGFLLVIVALIAGVTPIYVSRQESRNRKDEKKQDYERQDEVAQAAVDAAEKAANAALSVAEIAANSAKTMEEAQQSVAEDTIKVLARLTVIEDGQQQIHTLVNSDMSDSVSLCLTANELLLNQLKKSIAKDIAAGQPIDPEEEALISTTEIKVRDLRVKMIDRERQAKKLQTMDRRSARSDFEQEVEDEAAAQAAFKISDDAAADAAAIAARAAAVAARQTQKEL